MSILDHVTLNVTNYNRSKRFYDAALEPLGIRAVKEFEMFCGYGRERPQLWIGAGAASFQSPEQITPITPVHVAITARTRAEVDAFYNAAMEAGGRDFGLPGLRPHYHASYYGAFVLDPDGHNIEAVCHSAK